MITYGEYVTSILNQQHRPSPEADAVIRMVTWALSQDWMEWDLTEVRKWLTMQLAVQKDGYSVYKLLLDGLDIDLNCFEFIEAVLPIAPSGEIKMASKTRYSSRDLTFYSKRLLRHRIRANRAAKAHMRITSKHGRPMF